MKRAKFCIKQPSRPDLKAMSDCYLQFPSGVPLQQILFASGEGNHGPESDLPSVQSCRSRAECCATGHAWASPRCKMHPAPPLQCPKLWRLHAVNFDIIFVQLLCFNNHWKQLPESMNGALPNSLRILGKNAKPGLSS